MLNLSDLTRYPCWRAHKLEGVQHYLSHPFVKIQNPERLDETALSALRDRVSAMNFALYRIDPNIDFDHVSLKRLCQQIGLVQLDTNPFAESSGISEIRVATNGDKRQEYIPYSNQALNWHTDGYYNPPGKRINGFAMHTIRAGASGGQNQFLDHEILYLLLRDKDPALAACLFEDDAMTIPPGLEAGGNERPAQTGPVFSFDHSDRLTMRFTLRKRHISWKQSDLIEAALIGVNAILNDPDNPFILAHRFEAGEGVISNNVLHNRAAFTDPGGGEPGRMALRARFYDRIKILGV